MFVCEQRYEAELTTTIFTEDRGESGPCSIHFMSGDCKKSLLDSSASITAPEYMEGMLDRPFPIVAEQTNDVYHEAMDLSKQSAGMNCVSTEPSPFGCSSSIRIAIAPFSSLAYRSDRKLVPSPD